MDRQTARQTAVQALLATDSYSAVYGYEPLRFESSPVATVHSHSSAVGDIAHGEFAIASEVTVTLWVQIDNDPSACEDQIDDLSREALLTLHPLFAIGTMDGRVSATESGYRLLDGTVYRVERFRLIIQEEFEG